MADKILKSITFPGSEDVYKILVDYDDIENNILNRGEGLNSIQQELTLDEEDIAKGKAPQAIGECTVALGEYHMVEGEAGFACNYNNIVYGKRSFAANANQLVYADHGAAFGSHNRIVGLRGFSIGTDNFACGENSFTLGNQTRTGQLLNEYDAATNQYLPMQDDTGKDILDAEGNSVLFPDTTKGLRAIASGYLTQATGTNAIAAGNNTIASGSNAIAAGNNTIASGDNAFAIGSNAQSLGWLSFASGLNVTAEPNASFALGGHIQTCKVYQTVVGCYNDYTSDAAKSAMFIVGGGSTENRKNLFMVVDNGVYIGNHHLTESRLNSLQHIRAGKNADGDWLSASLIVGNSTCEATAGGTFVSGYDNKANGAYSLAGGRWSTASSSCSIAYGQGLKTEVVNAQAVFGKYNSANNKALFIVGNGASDTSRSNAFAVYDESITVGGQTLTSATISDIATKEYVNSKPAVYSGDYDPNQWVDEYGDFGKDGDIFIRYA